MMSGFVILAVVQVRNVAIGCTSVTLISAIFDALPRVC